MPAESHEFKTEMKQLMDIIVHSLYSHKEIFLRELISNAADAVDKARFESLTNADLLEGDADWKIKLVPDEDAGTLTISDNGIGMTRDSIAEDLGTIARSGTRAFVEQLKEAREQNLPELIGQFGVGFYSVFMVADRVTVVTRRAGPGETGVTWESDGHGTYTLEDTAKESRGTDVILHLKEDEKDFLKDWTLRQTVKRFSDFIEHPIVMDVERENEDKEKTVEEETLNSQQAIWLRSKDDVEDEQYAEFYKHISHDFENPAKTIHYSAEGVIEFQALLFIPARKPFDLFMPDARRGLQLYIKRVFVTDDCEELLPEYLRFVKGVVDASDLPLNVSREILQHNPQLEKIRRNLVNKVLDTLEELRDKERDAYVTFYEEFGPVLKEGIHTDSTNKDKLAELLLFHSSKSGADESVGLADYVDAMPTDQEDIYYLIGERILEMADSPHLEVFKARGHEVLFLTDAVDEWVVQGLGEYKGKKLKAVDKGEIEAGEDAEKKREEDAGEFSGLLESLGKAIEDVKQVRLSARLTDSAACLVSDENDMGAHMERLMQKLGREDELPGAKRILELNASHPAVTALKTLHGNNADDPRVEAYGRLLYEQAVIGEGLRLSNPAEFASRVNDLMVKDLQGASAGADADDS